MEARLLSLGAASTKAKPLFPMGTCAHCAYVRGWPQRSTQRKQHLHNHRQHKRPDPVPSLADQGERLLVKNI